MLQQTLPPSTATRHRTVTSVSVLDAGAGTTSHARLALTGEVLPESVFVKMSATAARTRLIGDLGRLAETETRFYGLDTIALLRDSS